MGHAFQDTIMDALIRYRRMQRLRHLWQPGTDHAGIATQMVVERQLNAAGQSRARSGARGVRRARLAMEGAARAAPSRSQMRRLGASVDWKRDRFTMDAGLSRAVTEVFVRLYQRGPDLPRQAPGELGSGAEDRAVGSGGGRRGGGRAACGTCAIRSRDGGGYLVVATTRPETMLGDAAVAVHPDDERYRHLIGRSVRLPLAGREIPVIGDAYVDPAFGSGCVKITPAHDFNDYEIGQRHATAHASTS